MGRRRNARITGVPVGPAAPEAPLQQYQRETRMGLRPQDPEGIAIQMNGVTNAQTTAPLPAKLPSKPGAKLDPTGTRKG